MSNEHQRRVALGRWGEAKAAMLPLQCSSWLGNFANYPGNSGVLELFGTIAPIEEKRERFSVLMNPNEVSRYECLASGINDSSILPDWSNGGYSRRRG